MAQYRLNPNTPQKIRFLDKTTLADSIDSYGTTPQYFVFIY